MDMDMDSDQGCPIKSHFTENVDFKGSLAVLAVLPIPFH